MKDVLNKYIEFFGEIPPILKMVSFNNKIYQELMIDALKTKKKITNFDIDEAFTDYKYDVVMERKNGK